MLISFTETRKKKYVFFVQYADLVAKDDDHVLLLFLLLPLTPPPSGLELNFRFVCKCFVLIIKCCANLK
jgi:hypothetical protein